MSGTATTTSAPSHSHNVPSNPKLQLDFKVVRKGRCPITYRATSIYLNKQLVAEIDFRRFAKNDNESLTISIPPNAVRSSIVSC